MGIRITNILFLMIMLIVPSAIFAHGGGLNKSGCHNNNSTGEYHCHRENKSVDSSTASPSIEAQDETYFNNILAMHLDGKTEVTLSYDYGLTINTSSQASVRIDILTNKYAIEGGLDKRSSLDSIQQAVFAASLAKKAPAIAIYDTDGQWGKYEHRIWQASKELNIRFIWVSQGQIIEK